MSIHDNSNLDQEEVLLSFAIDPSHDNETLARYVKEHPECASALAELSVELMLAETQKDKEFPGSDSSTVITAWQRFNNTLDKLTTDQEITNPFSKLTPNQLKAAADKIGINKLMLVRLRDRSIDLSTIPSRFIEQVAISLETTGDLLRTYLSSSPTIISGHSFCSDIKPTIAEQITFTQAIETSHLTESQQKLLKALMED